jgi:hypothetical protein
VVLPLVHVITDVPLVAPVIVTMDKPLAVTLDDPLVQLVTGNSRACCT